MLQAGLECQRFPERWWLTAGSSAKRFSSAFNKTVRFLLQLYSPGEAGGLHGFTRQQSLSLGG